MKFRLTACFSICLIICVRAVAQSPENLRRNLTYLASDELEGRATPSPGLELAADYIAQQFRAAGLETQFQTARFADVTLNFDNFKLTLNDKAFTKDEVRIRCLKALDLQNEPILLLPANGLLPDNIAGRIVVGDTRRYGTEEYLPELQARKPAVIILMNKSDRPGRLAPKFLQDADSGDAPVIRINRNLPKEAVTITLHLDAPAVNPVPLRNVTAILRGSDPTLQNQYVLLTAHYDHVGKTDKGIFHGANDNGSGTVSVIEIATALAAQKIRPKRSIVFITFFGEERGLLGSYYYARHPLYPLKDTVANINLEQLGRPESHPGTFGVSGPSYTDLPALLASAAKHEHVAFLPNKDADSYFARSDNYPFAQFGVPDLTVVVAFEFPEYHALGDTLDKIDFNNMAKIDRALAAGILSIANVSTPPKWSKSKPAAIYKEARGY